MSISVCALSLKFLSGHVGLFCSIKCILSWLNEQNKIDMTFLFYSTIHVRIIWPHFVIIYEVANSTSYYQNVYIEIAKLFMNERRSLFPITQREEQSCEACCTWCNLILYTAPYSTWELYSGGPVDHCPEARCSVLRSASAEQRPGRRCGPAQSGPAPALSTAGLSPR